MYTAENRKECIPRQEFVAVVFDLESLRTGQNRSNDRFVVADVLSGLFCHKVRCFCLPARDKEWSTGKRISQGIRDLRILKPVNKSKFERKRKNERH